MKKINSLLIVLLLLNISGCNNDDENTSPTNTVNGCDSSNTTFKQLYNNILNNASYAESVTMDTPVHSYTFEVTSPATICKVGYQSQPTFETFPYDIEIYNNTTNTIVYSGSHRFSSSTTEYVSINPVALNVGDSYTIKRTQNNYTNDITIFIGRIIRNSTFSNLNYPFNMGILKITSSSFSPTSNPDNLGLPFIDIVFE